MYEENENLLVIEIDVDADDSIVIENLKAAFGVEYIDESIKVDREITLKDKKGKEVGILIRTKDLSGGRSGNSSNHGASVKMTKPAQLKGVKIIIPGEGEIIADDPDKEVPKTYRKQYKMACDFVSKNREDLKNIFFAEDPESAKQSFINIIENNPELSMRKEIKVNDTDDMYDIYLAIMNHQKEAK